MADEVRYVEHPSADVSYLVNAVQGMESQLNNLSSEVVSVNTQVDSIQDSFAQFLKEFRDFVMQDLKDRRLQEALSDQVTLQQELEQRFSRHQRVRYFVTGILQAADTSLVKKETMAECTEELMVSVPHYWLAPALIALSAWLNDDRPLAEKALKEAISRDDEKTSLLFALICRRVGRMNASAVWLERYLAMQDPQAVERKMVTVLDAYSNGLFGPKSRQICAEKIEKWIAELSDEVGFVEEQQKNWEESMFAMVDGHSFDKKYPYSAKRGTNWKECTRSMNEMGLHEKLLNYFKNIFEKKTASTLSLNARLDALLENYVSSYDNAELPLRREERMLELIIEERGRKDRAQARFDAEDKALEESFDFTQLLTSAAMHADVIKASNATQRLAVALSKPWVVSAYNNIVLKVRQNVPARLNFEIENWSQSMVDGSEEAALCQEADQHFTNRRDLEMAAVTQSKWDAVIPIACAVVSLIAFISGSAGWGFIGLIAAAGFGLRWFLNKRNCEKTRENIKKLYEKIISDVKDTVRALCAERVDYINDLLQRDEVSDQTSAYLEGLEVGQYVGNGDHQRNIR